MGPVVHPDREQAKGKGTGIVGRVGLGAGPVTVPNVLKSGCGAEVEGREGETPLGRHSVSFSRRLQFRHKGTGVSRATPQTRDRIVQVGKKTLLLF